jgi:hypothetical protein
MSVLSMLKRKYFIQNVQIVIYTMHNFTTIAGEVNSRGRHVSFLRSRKLTIREIVNVCRYINTQFHDTAFSGSIIASIFGCRMAPVLF